MNKLAVDKFHVIWCCWSRSYVIVPSFMLAKDYFIAEIQTTTWRHWNYIGRNLFILR